MLQFINVTKDTLLFYTLCRMYLQKTELNRQKQTESPFSCYPNAFIYDVLIFLSLWPISFQRHILNMDIKFT